MSDLRAALRTYLLADPVVSGLVGAARIFPSVLAQGETSGLVINLVSEITDYVMQGPSGLVQQRIQVDAWAQAPDDAVALAEAVKERLSGTQALIVYGSASPQASVQVHGIFADQARDDYDDEAKLHTRRRDYLVWFIDV